MGKVIYQQFVQLFQQGWQVGETTMSFESLNKRHDPAVLIGEIPVDFLEPSAARPFSGHWGCA